MQNPDKAENQQKLERCGYTMKTTKQTKQNKTETSSTEQTLTDVMALVEADKLDKALASPKGTAVIKAFTQFAEIDYISETQSPLAGELFHKILAMPLDAQKKLVWAIADQQKVERPSYEQKGAGRPTTGRNELAAVLYAGHPDMLEKQGNKDSRASKRITDHVRRYLIKTGQKQQSKSNVGESEKSISTHALKTTFVALWNIGQSENERRVLVSLYMRLGVQPELMNKWTESGLLSLAAASLSSIDVQATAVG